MSDLQDVRDQLFAVLVRDFGYTSAPTHGHTPIRHQHAWVLAVKGRDPLDVEREANEDLAIELSERESTAERRDDLGIWQRNELNRLFEENARLKAQLALLK